MKKFVYLFTIITLLFSSCRTIKDYSKVYDEDHTFRVDYGNREVGFMTDTITARSYSDAGICVCFYDEDGDMFATYANVVNVKKIK